MIFKIILFLTVLGLQNIDISGKIYKTKIPAEQVKLKSRHKRVVHESEPSMNGQFRAQTVRDHLNTIEHYITAIRENLDAIERNLPGFQPSGQNVPSHDNSTGKIFGREFSEKMDPKIKMPKYQDKSDPFPSRFENGKEREKIFSYKDNGDNKTILSAFNQVTTPQMTWENVNDKLIESNRHFDPFDNNEFGDFPTNTNKNIMHYDTTESDQDYLQEDVQEVNEGMSNLYTECGRPIYPCNSNKQFIMNNKNDCSGRYNDRFMNGYPMQSRAHCRPYKSSPSSYSLSKYHTLNYRDMPRHWHQ